jgi:hypothetical protein
LLVDRRLDVRLQRVHIAQILLQNLLVSHATSPSSGLLGAVWPRSRQ